MPQPCCPARAGRARGALAGLLALALAAAPTAGEAARLHRRGNAPAQQDAAGPDAALMHVDLPTRIEQRCNARAMGEIGREHSDMRPEEVVAYAFADPRLGDLKRGDAAISAPGAAVRSRQHWYHLSYRCTTTPDGMDVVAFSYTLGAEVPRQEWEAHSLVP